jgi:hypothetical protein
MKKQKTKMVSKKPTLYGKPMVVYTLRLPPHIIQEIKEKYGNGRLALERLLKIDNKKREK